MTQVGGFLFVIDFLVGVFDFFFDGPDGSIAVCLDVVAPEAENDPASCRKVLVDLFVALDVAVDLAGPEFGIVDGAFTGFPILSVEEFGVNKYGNLVFLKSQVGCAENGLAVFTVAVATFPEALCQAYFGLGVFAFDAGHYLASLLGGKDIHCFALGVAVWIKLGDFIEGWG